MKKYEIVAQRMILKALSKEPKPESMGLDITSDESDMAKFEFLKYRKKLRAVNKQCELKHLK